VSLRWLCIAGICGASILAVPQVAGAQGLTRWVAVWTTSLQEIPQSTDLLGRDEAPEVSGKTVRQIIFPSLGGGEVRLHISNRYGRGQLGIVQATFAKAAGSGAALSDPVALVTFDGKDELQLPPGGEADSDPIKINLVGHQAYAVSLYLGPHQNMQAWHRFARQVNFISDAGDHSRDATAEAFRQSFTQFAWITSLSVADPTAGGVIAIGDSITDGVSSTIGLNRRWPDDLSRRLAVDGKMSMAVLNAGIAGNRLLSDSPCYGESLAARFEREIAGRANVQTAIVLIGINDINFAATAPRDVVDCGFPYRQITAENLIAGYRGLIEVAHRHHVRLLLGTLAPAALPADREAIRQAVNRWIRSDNGFDGVIDFDEALRDEIHPQDLRAAYDSGDHLHPSDAGYAAMAEAVPLNLLSAPTGPQLTATR
jgi:lysophospholipase L1-like esterase